MKIEAHFGGGGVTTALVPVNELKGAISKSSRPYNFAEPCTLKRIHTQPRRSIWILSKHYTHVWMYFDASAKHGDLVVVQLSDLRAALNQLKISIL